MAESYRTPTKSELALLIAAESRIDIAIAELLLAMNGVKDASKSQEVAVTELRQAREAIRALRERIDHPTA